MSRDDKPAFPLQDWDPAIHAPRRSYGMTLREYAAIKAMQGLLAAESVENGFNSPEQVARASIARADALLAELEKPR